jgi:hypothetical protein
MSYLNAALLAMQLLGAVLIGAPAAAQTRYHVNRQPGELFAAFVRERESLNDETNAALDITHVLLYHREYPPENVEYFLNKLEQFALAGSPQWLRGECVYKLATPGSKRGVAPISGSFARLERIYRRSDDPLVKMAVVGAMGTLIETREASVFLERVATKDSQDFPGAPRSALTSLLVMGDDGRVVLMRLHETGAVRDPEARLSLFYLAKKGYRIK